MRHHRLLSLASRGALLTGPQLGRADDADKSILKADRPFLFEVEGVWSYIESEAKLSSTIGSLLPSSAQARPAPGRSSRRTTSAGKCGSWDHCFGESVGRLSKAVP